MGKEWVSRINYIMLSITFLAILFNLIEASKSFTLLTTFFSIMYFLENDLKECE